MDENVYYNKKKSIWSFILPVISLIVIAGMFYFINFFNINPCGTLQFINSGKMQPTYARDYIFSITGNDIGSEIPELQVIVNEDLNTDMSESMQRISLSVGESVFDWERFFKFDTAIIKTPYDTRYIRIDDYNNKYSHSYNNNTSNLTSILIPYLSENSNLIIDSNDYENKKIKVNFSGIDFNEKVKIYYTVNFKDSVAADMFNTVYDKIWNSKEFESFFKEDNDIQNALKIENSTKEMIDLIYNIKNNSTILDVKVDLAANKDYVESIIYSFNVAYDDGVQKHNITLSISEYLKPLHTDYSPEDLFEALSVINFDSIKPQETNNVGDEIKVDNNAGSTAKPTEKETDKTTESTTETVDKKE